MKIIKLIPHGFCFGVINAYKKTLKIIEDNPNKTIYMLGWIVHNKDVVNELENKGVIVLDDRNTSRYDLVASIKSNKNSILILSAHGTSNNVIQLAKQKNLEIYDLTCKFVYKTHDIIKQKISDGYTIIFIGKKNHPETIAILNIDRRIILVEAKEDIDNLDITNKKIFCTNQTTLGKIFFSEIVEKLKQKYNSIEIENDICDATNLRQEAVINMPNDVDLCIVIGDMRSSNCNELYKLAKQKVNDSYIIQCIDDLSKVNFLNKKLCAITAAASTPKKTIDLIFDFISKI